MLIASTFMLFGAAGTFRDLSSFPYASQASDSLKTVGKNSFVEASYHW